MTLAAGERLGAYEILAPLGAGGMADVYRARDTRLGREVAVKVLSARVEGDPGALARLDREARIVASLSHPNIVALYDVGHDDGATYVVMELLDGTPLDRAIADGVIDWRRATEIAIALSEGIASAHARGVIHRDLKPSNVFLTRDGLVKVLDFGLARQDPFPAAPADETARAGDTKPGVVLGTLGYMSPEQVRGEPADERSDLFAAGCLLFEMITGARAFDAPTPAETLVTILRDAPAPWPRGLHVPATLTSIVRRCLEKDPDRRFQSAKDLAFALRSVRDTSAPPRVARVLGLTAGVAAAIGVVAWLGVRTHWFGLVGTHARAVAVLPLADLSGDPSQEYFADAMTEELTTRLASLGTWRVTSRTSVMRYRGTHDRASAIGKALGVDTLIEGSVVHDASRVKVSVQVVDAATDSTTWAVEYERDLASVLVVQDDLARAIAREVNLKVTPAANAHLQAATRPVLPAAYEAYVRGRHALDKRSEAELHAAIRFFESSIDADPTYAPAYAGLADCYAQLGYGSYESPDDTFPRARKAAERAIEFDPTLAEAHASLGYVLMYYAWDFPGAEREFQRAITLDPNYAPAHDWRAYLLTATSRPFEAADSEIAIAHTLDPLSVPIVTDRAFILHYYGRNSEAEKSVQLGLEMDATSPLAYFWLGRIYLAEGRDAEAEGALQQIGPLRTWVPGMAVLGYMYGKRGKTDDARRVLDEFAQLARSGRYASSYAIALVQAGLGDRDRVFSSLDAAYRERSHWLVWLQRDPRWDDVRSDPRFADLVHRVGLPAR